MHRQLVAVLHFAHDGRDIGKIELGVNALGIHIHRQGDDINVAGALAIPKQRTLNAISSGHQRQLCRRNAGTAVVMGVNADNQVVAVFDVATEPLDLVGVVVGRGDFYRGRQVHDHGLIGAGAVSVHDRFDDLNGKVHLGGSEEFRRVLERPVGFWCGVHLRANLLGCFDGDLHAFSFIDIEHHPAKHGIGSVIDVDDSVFGAL